MTPPAGSAAPDALEAARRIEKRTEHLPAADGVPPHLELVSWSDARTVACALVASAAREATLRQALTEMEQRKDAAYLERNKCVAAIAMLLPSGIARTAIPGWSDDWHGCVYIDLPTGQASWHYHDSHAHLFAHLPTYAKQWDGHTTDEKYERLAALAGGSVRASMKPEARILVTGGRDYRNQHLAFDYLDGLLAKLDARQPPFEGWPETTGKIKVMLIQGGATGADALARLWAKKWSDRVIVITEKANWVSDGKAAGPRRNQRMIDLHQPDIVVAFPGGRGTGDMVAKAHKAKITVVWAQTTRTLWYAPRARRVTAQTE